MDTHRELQTYLRAGDPVPVRARPDMVEITSRLASERNDLMLLLALTAGEADEIEQSREPHDVESEGAAYDVVCHRRESLALRLRLVDEAVARLKQGSYGRCVECLSTIPVKRVALDPAVRLCVDCQTAAERGEAQPSL